MAISLYICRTDRPDQASENPITLKEWINLVNTIPELHLYSAQDALPDYISPPAVSEGLVRWSGHPYAKVVWFYYRDGAIATSGYDAYVAMRMRSLATRLQARLIDDDGRRI